MSSYELMRAQYRPAKIRFLLIAESPPPSGEVSSSRHFYRADYQKGDDRLFSGTMRGIYSDAAELPSADLEAAKADWLRRFQADGFYMIEALDKSQIHKVTKKERQERLRENLPAMLKRVSELAGADTNIILIKSNVYEVAADPLRQAGFIILNTALLDYPGRFNQRAYKEKLGTMLGAAGWKQ